MMHAFAVSSVMRGYHEYKDVWSTSIDGTELPCEREPGNLRDTLAVAVIEQSPSNELTLDYAPNYFSYLLDIHLS